MISKGIDASAHITNVVAADLVKNNYSFVCRYIVPVGYSKRLSISEAEIISNAGMKILCVYETTASRAKGGSTAGDKDGSIAFNEAQILKMPKSAIIYFAVDFDARSNDMDSIEAYLKAARGRTGDYEVGVHGSYSVIEQMAQRGACKGFWQTYAWSIGKQSQYATVYQHKNGQMISGIMADLNEAYSDVGMWNYKALDNLPSAWAAEAVNKAIAKGIKGDENGDLKLHEPVTFERLLVTLDRVGLL